MRVPELPLPDDVPELPAGCFYRVKREDLVSIGPRFTVEIRRQGKRFSHAVYGTETRIVLDKDSDPEVAVRQACRSAVAEMTIREQERAVWRGADRYVGDHGREAS
ncbi:hypothetical protein BKA00_007438 [Actinomadura coerulea]|uniref:Uncharacterized protein n=1 Tax=Actinomadura coerulea TaxID=46159 RepID=A0A7X0G6T1_9ACTN|nr:hypothetical protein [Actinomadura coerulea]MBB6400524.1 hypothetical protein [Actinomadura coerulea]GGQ07836.1 hypothetical protein GCM10010187_24910 [Actinomadura coerulea]